MKPTPLDPFIRRLADHYSFDVAYCDVLCFWSVKHQSHGTYFFWRSDETVAAFLDELKKYFADCAVSKSLGY